MASSVSYHILCERSPYLANVSGTVSQMHPLAFVTAANLDKYSTSVGHFKALSVLQNFMP